MSRTYWKLLLLVGIVGLVIIYSTATNLKTDPLSPYEKVELPANEKETYVIFLSGLDSYCDGTPYNQMGFEYIRNQFNQVGLTYDDEHFLMYSYTGGKVEAGRWYPNPYNPVDTGQPIQFGVIRLKDMIDEFTLHHPQAKYILVGHSLGGRIAFDYAAKYHLRKPGPIKSVITLNSPLTGTSYDRVVNILTTFQSIWGSPVIKQLAAEYRLRNELGLVEQKIQAARRMTEAGIKLATFGTRQDIIVNPLLACLTDEHGYPLTGGHIVSAKLSAVTFKELGGHMQILSIEKVADYIILVYSSPSNPTGIKK
jgi:hypothetical protein